MDIRGELKERLAKREQARFDEAVSLIETAASRAIDQAVERFDPPRPSPSPTMPPPAPDAQQEGGSDALIALAAAELSRHRPGSTSWLYQLEQTSGRVAALTGQSVKDVAERLALAATSRAQQGAVDVGNGNDNDNGNDNGNGRGSRSGARNWLRSLVAPDAVQGR